MKILHHRLCITDIQQSLTFYCQKLGMTLVSQRENSGTSHLFLTYDNTSSAMLELVYDPKAEKPLISPQPSRTEGYWKFSVAVPDLERARQQLLNRGVPVGRCFEVPDVAYLCHLQDPDGYCIELIQQTFQSTFHSTLYSTLYSTLNSTFQNSSSSRSQCEDALNGAAVSLNLSTLRVRNISVSLEFYQSMGMTLLSRQTVPDRNMTLYFLSGSSEQAPVPDVDAVEIREWLWQRPYTLLELQHIHGTEHQAGFQYRVGDKTGFLGLDLQGELPRCHSSLLPEKDISVLTVDGLASGRELVDPDGYRLRVLDRA